MLINARMGVAHSIKPRKNENTRIKEWNSNLLFKGRYFPLKKPPKILETPILSNATTPTNNATVLLPISAADINEIIEKTFPAVNLGLFIALSVILISAGSVIMGKGVGLIKEIKLRAVRESVKEVSEEIKVEEKKEK